MRYRCLPCARDIRALQTVRLSQRADGGARGRLLMPVAPKDARERGDHRPYLLFCVAISRAREMPAPAVAFLWPSAAAHVDGSASANRNRLRNRRLQRAMARSKGQNQLLPWMCGSRNGVSCFTCEGERLMHTCEHGRAWAGVPFWHAEATCAPWMRRCHAADAGTSRSWHPISVRHLKTCVSRTVR